MARSPRAARPNGEQAGGLTKNGRREIGRGTDSWADSDFFWAAAGPGTLTNSQAAQLAGYTDPPNLGLMPGTATFRWAADDATAYVR